MVLIASAGEGEYIIQNSPAGDGLYSTGTPVPTIRPVFVKRIDKETPPSKRDDEQSMHESDHMHVPTDIQFQNRSSPQGGNEPQTDQLFLCFAVLKPL